jgi:hypothetical protein
MRLGLATFAISLLLAAAAQAQEDPLSALDTNHDGVVSKDEALAAGAGGWDYVIDRTHEGQVQAAIAIRDNPQAAMMLRGVTANDTGAITRQGYLETVSRRFDKADANRDGVLDPAELAAYLGLPAAVLANAATPQPLGPILAVPVVGGAPLPRCADLASDPRFGLAGESGTSRLTAAVVLASGSTRQPYCRVEFTYNSGKSGPADGYREGESQAIGIRIGLPLRADEGGGAGWNGKVENLGSGGCMGNLPAVTAATNAGYVGSSSDGGHGAPSIGFNCSFGVNQDSHTLNVGKLRDFSRDHVIWQTKLTKKVAATYYGRAPERTYWAGCSQGGREGFIAAQVIPEEYDGILAGGAALNWMRFQMAQAWSGLVVKDMLATQGKTLTPAQIATTTALAIKACDGLDGVVDGVLGDPRQCRWSARAAICGRAGTEAETCLDSDQAKAYDLIRAGPRNAKGELIFFPWEPDTTFSRNTNYLLSDGVMQWAVSDTGFSSQKHLYMDRAHLRRAHDPMGVTYEDMATLASQRLSALVDTDSTDLAAARAHGTKILAWTGTADRNIPSRISIAYYRQVAARHGQQDAAHWFRLFLYPGVDHCGGGVGPQPGPLADGPLFHALTDWVEHGTPPERLVVRKTLQTGGVATRPVCAYPKTAIYPGKGAIDDAANFVCGGDLETPQVVGHDRLARHRHENGTGIVVGPYARR